MAVTNSPNMLLPIPSVGSQPGPDFAFNVNQALTLIDQHDHSPGKGIQITPAGMNINADLTLNDNNLTNANSIVFDAQGSPDATLLSLYVAPGTESPTPINDLWFTDGVGNPVQLTSNGLVNATIASLPGESYAFGTFTWRQVFPDLVGAPANFDIGSITLRPNIVATTFGITLNASNIITSYDWIFPAALPIPANSFLTLTSAGVLGYVNAAGGIGTANIADGAITGPKLATGLGTLTSQTFTTSGSFTVTVPTRVTEMFAKLTAAGGGGGGGGRSGIGGGGGAGGQGSAPVITAFSVTPGDVLTITLGAGGTAGLGATAAAPVTGGSGGQGGVAEIVNNGTVTVCLVAGGAGGAGGVGATSGPTSAGGTGVSSIYTANSFTSSGGNGGNGATVGTAGSQGGASFTSSGGTGGAGTAGGAGGGGGGGAGLGNGANGGAGNTAGTAAVNAGSGGGGGGGGTNSGSGTTTGKNGGAGASGSITLYWIP